MQRSDTSLRRYHSGVQDRLAREVLRKLNLAVNADVQDDRDTVCKEVFEDITGKLNEAAKETTGTIYTHWYEVLAPYFCKTPTASENLLVVCRKLWGQLYIGPIFTLLLHQWILVHPDAGGTDQRLKLLNVMVSGAKHLFIGDAESGGDAFASLYDFITEAVVLSYKDNDRLNRLPSPGREGIMGLTASFLPYYSHTSEATFLTSLRYFPAPFTSGRARTAGLDFAIDKIVDALSRDIKSVDALTRYINALSALKLDPELLSSMRTSTRMRLQGELYSLTQPGGPRYAPRQINKIAFRTLDSLFPHGRINRRLINLGFRFLHPGQWPWVWWDTVSGGTRAWWRGVSGATRMWWRGVCAWWRGVVGTVRAGWRGVCAWWRGVASAFIAVTGTVTTGWRGVCAWWRGVSGVFTAGWRSITNSFQASVDWMKRIGRKFKLRPRQPTTTGTTDSTSPLVPSSSRSSAVVMPSNARWRYKTFWSSSPS